MIDKEEIEKANKFLKEMEIEGYRWTAEGREKYIVENVFHKITELEKERDYYKKMYAEFNNAFIKGGNTEE